MTNIDALAEATYASRDPQFADEEQAERLELNDAIDQITDDIDTIITELDAIKYNFTTRKFNRFKYILEEVRDEIGGSKDD